MTEKMWISCVATLCLGLGLVKVLWPQFFLDLRRRYPWSDFLDIYSFIFKSTYAERAVRVNGYLLLVIGFGLVVWVVFK